jgi:hypothetical protein
MFLEVFISAYKREFLKNPTTFRQSPNHQGNKIRMSSHVYVLNYNNKLLVKSQTKSIPYIDSKYMRIFKWYFRITWMINFVQLFQSLFRRRTSHVPSLMQMSSNKELIYVRRMTSSTFELGLTECWFNPTYRTTEFKSRRCDFYCDLLLLIDVKE